MASIGKYQSLIGFLCFNIWHNTKDDFIASNDYRDMEWPFLCSFYIFHHWDDSRLSKTYSLPDLMSEISFARRLWISWHDTPCNLHNSWSQS